jgi:hypothetical protein
MTRMAKASCKIADLNEGEIDCAAEEGFRGTRETIAFTFGRRLRSTHRLYSELATGLLGRAGAVLTVMRPGTSKRRRAVPQLVQTALPRSPATKSERQPARSLQPS